MFVACFGRAAKKFYFNLVCVYFCKEVPDEGRNMLPGLCEDQLLQ